MRSVSYIARNERDLPERAFPLRAIFFASACPACRSSRLIVITRSNRIVAIVSTECDFWRRRRVPTRKKRKGKTERKRKKEGETIGDRGRIFFGDTLFVNALPLYYLLFLLLLYVTSLCTTLCAGYFCTWPVRYTNGRRTRAELSVAARSRSRVHVHETTLTTYISVRTYTRTYIYIYMYVQIHIYTRICTHTRVDRCTCPCFARPSVTLNRSNSVREMIKRTFSRCRGSREKFLSINFPIPTERALRRTNKIFLKQTS